MTTRLEMKFCKKWFRAKKRPLDPLTEDEAQLLHQNQEPYGVLVFKDEKLFSFLEIKKGYVGVGFFDDFQREYLIHQYQQLQNDDLFLTMVISRQFQDHTDQVHSGRSYIYSETGKTIVRKSLFIPNHQFETLEFQSSIQKHYEKFPQFKLYNNFLDSNRIDLPKN